MKKVKIYPFEDKGDVERVKGTNHSLLPIS